MLQLTLTDSFSQSALVIDLYFMSQIYAEDPCHQKPVLILLTG